MTPQEIDLVQRSFDKVALERDGFAVDFYDRLFELDPSLRGLFDADLTAQRRKLTAMLVTVICNLRSPDLLHGALVRLGQRHVGYQVRTEYYAIAGEALIWALRRNLGDDWTPALQQAWLSAYNTLAGMMQAAA